ncbi:MAG TPA: hypothetical protein VJ203_12475 [Bacteroidales bacterium]|nr:hypothetical protein [Bacteroidales bacterium]
MLPAITPFIRLFRSSSASCRSFKYMLFFHLFLLLTPGVNSLANTSVPPVIAFTKNEYGADRQNWNIAQDQQGIMYFANNAGLLQFDGSNWQLFRMPEQLGIRSVAIGTNGRIYTGAYEEFGYWEQQADGLLIYTSLSKQLKDYEFNNDEIWRIIIVGPRVFFQSFGTYFVYDGKQVVQYNTPEAVVFFLKTGDYVITQGMQSGLFSLKDDSLQYIPGSDMLKNAIIRAAVQLEPGLILLGTSSQGLFVFDTTRNRFTRWKTEADELLVNGQINCGIMAADSVICFGTIGNGIIAIDRNGKLLWHFNKENSLPTNTVLFLYTDLQKNIWAALDQGVALVRINSPFRYITTASDNIELVYTAVRFNKVLYIGTNQGVFRSDSTAGNRFKLLHGTQGQVWQLVEIDDQLLCGHNEGTFRIENDRVIPVSTATGGTTIRRFTSPQGEYLLQGTYGPLAVYRKDAGGKWTYSHSVRGFSHPVRYLEVDHLGFVWASNFIKGLYRIKLNDDLTEAEEVRTFGVDDGLPSDHKLSIARINGRVVICTGRQFYTYDDLSDRLVSFVWLNRNAGEFASSHLVIPAGEKRYWFVKKGRFALAEVDNDSLIIRDILPFSLLQNNLIDDNENIALLDKDRYLFCLENGLVVYERKATDNRPAFQPRVLIRKIQVYSNKSTQQLPLVYTPRARPVIPYYYRRIMFTFAYPDYSGSEVSLHCTLKSYRETITDTVTGQLVTYAYLEAGQYELSVVAVDDHNRVLGTTLYNFHVRPPFYASVFAYLAYLVLLLLAAWFGWRGIKLHIQRQNENVKQEQVKLQQERIERREQKITLLKNDKLEAELRHKSKELASSTLAIIRKNEMLLQLKKEVENQKHKLGSQFPNKYADHLIRMINDNISSDDDWEIFQQNFDLIHENFFRHIKSNYADVTAHDLKLCAFIRLNLSTKEIASLLNITVRGVEAARYRLRKKFVIPAEKNLTEFLIELK